MTGRLVVSGIGLFLDTEDLEHLRAADGTRARHGAPLTALAGHGHLFLVFHRALRTTLYAVSFGHIKLG